MKEEEIPLWVRERRFLMNDDEIFYAAELIRWLCARVGKKELDPLVVAPLAHSLFARDIRVYNSVHQLCMTHGENKSFDGFIEVFPELGYHAPSVDDLIQAAREGFPKSTRPMFRPPG